MISAGAGKQKVVGGSLRQAVGGKSEQQSESYKPLVHLEPSSAPWQSN